ncbi:serine/threonine-protein kinase Nek2-like [Diretmus argenteus]
MPSHVEDYEVLDTIADGSFGKCQKIQRKSDGKILAWKEIYYGKMAERKKRRLMSEVNLLRELMHPNIVRYQGHILDETNTKLYIVMEYCEGGDLSSLITRCIKEMRYLEEKFILRVVVQLTLALKQCHRRKDGGATVLHRDLKPANVFLDVEQNVKLGDFGLARILKHDAHFTGAYVGTPYYMSPEQINRTPYDEKSDIWSLGCLLYELCALSRPFTACNQQELAEKIRAGKFRRIANRYSEELNTLLCKMLHLKDYRRPSVDAILQSRLLADVVTEERRKVQAQLPRRSADSSCPMHGRAGPASPVPRRSADSSCPMHGLAVHGTRRSLTRRSARKKAVKFREEKLKHEEKLSRGKKKLHSASDSKDIHQLSIAAGGRRPAPNGEGLQAQA